MKNNRNRQVILKSRPADIPQADNFEIIESDVPDLRDGQILVHNIYLSVEPAMRGWVSNVANYSEPVRIGEVMRSFAAGEVLQSAHPDFKPGDKVMGMFGWQEFAVVGACRRHAKGQGRRPAAFALARRHRSQRDHRLFRAAGRRPTAPRRYRGGVDRGRRGRIGGRRRSRKSRVAGRSGLPAGRRRSPSAASCSATTRRSITRATIWNPRSPGLPKRRQSSISTTPVARSATLSCAISPSALAW